MPRGDGTGPNGAGPMTGRAAGYCTDSPMAGYARPGRGRGRGRGYGRGGRFGGLRADWRPRSCFDVAGVPEWVRAAWGLPPREGDPNDAAPTREQLLDALKDEAQFREEELDKLKKRVAELEAEKNGT